MTITEEQFNGIISELDIYIEDEREVTNVAKQIAEKLGFKVPEELYKCLEHK